MVAHFFQLFLYLPIDTTQVNSWRMFHVNDGFHDKLGLDGQRLVLFFIHVFFVGTINVDLLAFFEAFENVLFG